MRKRLPLLLIGTALRGNPASGILPVSTSYPSRRNWSTAMPSKQPTGATTTPEERAAAAAMRTGDGNAAASADVNGAAEVGNTAEKFLAAEIDNGTQKYVLIEATDPTTGQSVHLVRGSVAAAYHKDAARNTVRALKEAGWPYNVLGGGRINHDAGRKEILVYGHSFGFPWQGDFRHDISTTVLKKSFLDYTSIEWSNEGY
jgi:phosphohistidine phosphatase